jgi:protein disulfide isomerase
MRILTIVLITILVKNASNSVPTGGFGYPETDGMIELQDSNFETIIKKFNYVAMVAYVPYCADYVAMKPLLMEYSKRLRELDPPVPLGRLHIWNEPETAKKGYYQVTPTMSFWTGGNRVYFDGSRNIEDMVFFAKKWMGNPARDIVNVEHMKKLKERFRAFTTYLGPESGAHYDNFIKAANSFGNYTEFAQTFDRTITSNYNSEVVIFKQYDEGVTEYTGDYSVESIKEFVAQNIEPIVISFDEEWASDRIFNQRNSAVFFFGDNKTSQEYKDFHSSAVDSRDQILFVYVNVKSTRGARLLKHLKIRNIPFPLIWIVQPEGKDMKKYPLTEAIGKDSIRRLIRNFKQDKLTRHLVSGPIPVQKPGEIQVVVGDNYREVVLQEGVHVLVMHIITNCVNCHNFVPTFHEAALLLEKYKNPKIKMVEINVTENDVPDSWAEGYPVYKFFPADDKQNPKSCPGGRKAENFINFLRENTGEDWYELEEDEHEEDHSN